MVKTNAADYVSLKGKCYGEYPHKIWVENTQKGKNTDLEKSVLQTKRWKLTGTQHDRKAFEGKFPSTIDI